MEEDEKYDGKTHNKQNMKEIKNFFFSPRQPKAKISQKVKEIYFENFFPCNKKKLQTSYPQLKRLTQRKCSEDNTRRQLSCARIQQSIIFQFNFLYLSKFLKVSYKQKNIKSKTKTFSIQT